MYFKQKAVFVFVKSDSLNQSVKFSFMYANIDKYTETGYIEHSDMISFFDGKRVVTR